jgi:hypothetical protein
LSSRRQPQVFSQVSCSLSRIRMFMSTMSTTPTQVSHKGVTNFRHTQAFHHTELVVTRFCIALRCSKGTPRMQHEQPEYLHIATNSHAVVDIELWCETYCQQGSKVILFIIRNNNHGGRCLILLLRATARLPVRNWTAIAPSMVSGRGGTFGL